MGMSNDLATISRKQQGGIEMATTAAVSGKTITLDNKPGFLVMIAIGLVLVALNRLFVDGAFGPEGGTEFGLKNSSGRL